MIYNTEAISELWKPIVQRRTEKPAQRPCRFIAVISAISVVSFWNQLERALFPYRDSSRPAATHWKQAESREKMIYIYSWWAFCVRAQHSCQGCSSRGLVLSSKQILTDNRYDGSKKQFSFWNLNFFHLFFLQSKWCRDLCWWQDFMTHSSKKFESAGSLTLESAFGLFSYKNLLAIKFSMLNQWKKSQ